MVEIVDTLGELVANNLEVSAALVSFVSAWILYGVLGKRFLGADDDFWEKIRYWILVPLDKVVERYGLYTTTKESKRRYAGYIEMSEEDFEVVIEDELRYLRQPLSSIHFNHMGWREDGSWGRTFSPMFSAALIMEKVPAIGGVIGRFLSSLDTILALKQDNLVIYTEVNENGPDRVHINHHTEWNPLNPFTAFLHYTKRPTATPEKVVERLRGKGYEITEP